MTAERERENYSPLARFVSPTWPNLENILHELKTVFPNGDFVIEGCVDPREASREEGPNRSRATATRRTRRQTAIDWGTFPGQSNRDGAVRTRRAQQQTDSLPTAAPGGGSTGLARDTRQLPERFTLEAKRERLLIHPAIGT